MSEDQRALLESLVLQAMNDQGSYDGYDFDELTVSDRDCTRAIYSTTGCPQLRIQGNKALLPNIDYAILTSGATAACAD